MRRGVLVMILLCVVPLALWAGTAPLSSRFANATTSLTSAAVLFAFAGTAAFALNLILGARLRPVEALFGGLDNMYRAHRANGRIVFVLLLTHALLIIAGRATISSDAVTALFSTADGWTVLLGVVALCALSVAIVLTLYVRLGHEVFVYVQRSFGFIFLVASLHVFRTPGAKALSAPLTYYMGALVLLGIAAFAYRSLFADVLVRRLRYRVVRVNRLDDAVTEVVMEPISKELQFIPGQFLFVNFRSLELARRFQPLSISSAGQSAVLSIRAGEISNQFHPFSITSAPGDRQLRITVKAVGDYTRALRTLEEGAEAIVEGPYGAFSHRRVRNPDQVWISGGIGLTPFLSMARSLGGEEDVSVDLYYAVENDDETYFLEEFEAIAERHKSMRVFPIIRERVGFLTAEFMEETSGELATKDFLICGPPAMIVNIRSQLIAKGVPEKQIHSEEFGFARLGRRPTIG